ncbi:MAG: hypothetical protein J6C37_07210 [Roseburia sp.]|nr:hypothetical protein [Roseburia sp.]
MRKKYKKPEIMFESFSLNTNIAGDCEVKTWTPNQGKCAYTYEDEFLGEVNLFIDDVYACTTKDADGEYDGFCYHVPIESNTLFNS